MSSGGSALSPTSSASRKRRNSATDCTAASSKSCEAVELVVDPLDGRFLGDPFHLFPERRELGCLLLVPLYGVGLTSWSSPMMKMSMGRPMRRASRNSSSVNEKPPGLLLRGIRDLAVLVADHADIGRRLVDLPQ